MLSLLLKRHQAKVARWRARLGLSEYQVFWMGFGEGFVIGVGLGIGLVWIYLIG